MEEILVFPEIVFHDEQVALDTFSFYQYILTQFVVCQQTVSEYIGFSNNVA